MRHIRGLVAIVALVVFSVTMSGTALGLPGISSDKFQTSDGCGCHAALLEQWSKSMHAKALSDPLYQLKLSEANKATDGALGPFCDACHGPVAVMAGENKDWASASPQSLEAVACDFCHQVDGTTEPIGNTSQTLIADGTKRAQWADAKSPAHATAYSAFHESAEFCGACHNVDHPANGMHLEATYTEWKNGPYAEEGIVCQDCHMTPGPGVTKPNPGTAAAGGPQRDHIYLMTFAGGNVGLGDAALAEERLQAAVAMDLEAPEILEPGSKGEVTVTLTNVGAGHYVPTGLTEVREMWLEVTADDGSGEPEVIGTHVFGSILKDAEGNSPVELWEAVAFESDDRIPPRESVTDTFEVTMPEGGEVTLSAALYYRSASEEMAEKAGVEIPTTTMVEMTTAVYGSEEIAAEASRVEAGQAGGGNGGALIWAIGGLAAAIAFAAFFVMRGRKQNA